MGTLSAGKRREPDGECGRLRLHLDHHLLMAQKLDAGTSLLPPAPVTPEYGSRADYYWMQQDTHLTRLRCVSAIPLALPA